MNITRNSENFTLTDAELYQAYVEQQHRFLVEDAQRHLLDVCGMDDCTEDDEMTKVYAEFLHKYGFSLVDACTASNPNYLLEGIISLYEHDRDCNIAENITWDNAILRVLQEHRKA